MINLYSLYSLIHPFLIASSLDTLSITGQITDNFRCLLSDLSKVAVNPSNNLNCIEYNLIFTSDTDL